MNFKTNVLCLGLFAVSIMGLASCTDAKKKSNAEVWQIKSPSFEIETAAANGAPTNLRFDNVIYNKIHVTVKPSDRIVFPGAQNESGSTVLLTTMCATSGAPYEKIIRLVLAPSVEILEFLPIETLFQSTGRLTSIDCHLRLTATSKNGSTHEMGPIPFTLDPTYSENDLILIESRNGVLGSAHSEGYVGISKHDMYNVHLPKLERDQNYWLKCDNFELRVSNQKETIGHLLELRQQSDEVDHLCRLLIESNGAIKKMSNFFMLDLFNVDNLVDHVEMSDPFPEVNGNKDSFKIATVTFLNQTNKIYYTHLNTHSVKAVVTWSSRGELKQAAVDLKAKWTFPADVWPIEPNRIVRLSLRLSLQEVCRMSTGTVKVYISTGTTLPTVELSSENPAAGKFKIEKMVPLIAPASTPVIIDQSKMISIDGNYPPIIKYCSPNDV